jgi:hypothetical protein
VKENRGEIKIKEEVVTIETKDGVEILDVLEIKIHERRERRHPREHHVHVEVITTAGTWPSEGFAEVNRNQVVKIALERATKNLEIKDTANWVAKVGSKEINPEQNYHAQGLSGHIEIDYGPRAGGGGNE